MEASDEPQRLSRHQRRVDLFQMWGEVVHLKEVVFLGGCPHCGDAIPAIVTMIIHEPHDTEVSYYGEVSDELKFELSCKPSARIFACKKINEEE